MYMACRAFQLLHLLLVFASRRLHFSKESFLECSQDTHMLILVDASTTFSTLTRMDEPAGIDILQIAASRPTRSFSNL